MSSYPPTFRKPTFGKSGAKWGALSLCCAMREQQHEVIGGASLRGPWWSQIHLSTFIKGSSEAKTNIYFCSTFSKSGTKLFLIVSISSKIFFCSLRASSIFCLLNSPVTDKSWIYLFNIVKAVIWSCFC